MLADRIRARHNIEDLLGERIKQIVAQYSDCLTYKQELIKTICPLIFLTFACYYPQPTP
jgi:hypothetical protein